MRTAVLLLLMFSLLACGKSGPLYLPPVEKAPARGAADKTD